MGEVTPVGRILSELAKIPGVQGVFVIGKDGLVLESIKPSGAIDEEALAAMVVAAIGSLASMGEELKLGKVEINITEYSGSIVLTSDLGEHILVLVAERNAVLGRLRYGIRKYAPRIAAALEVL